MQRLERAWDREAPDRGQPEDADAFWARFAAETWEKRTTVLAGADAALLPTITPDELLPAVVACAESFLAGDEQKVRLYVDGDQVDVREGKLGELLPGRRDGSFEAYDHRMTQQHGFRDYALVIADWHQFSRPLWERIVGSVAGLTRFLGISASRMDTQVFLGTYRRTPFGVHVDETSAFHFPILGTKRMRFWDASYVRTIPALRHARHYEAFLERSSVAEARPGEVIYWPSSAWHVGESSGEFSVTWRFAYWLADGLRRRAMVSASELFDAARAGPLTSLPATPARCDRIEGVEQILRDMEAVVHSTDLRARLVAGWLEQCSSFGFLRVPAPEPAVARAGRLRRRPPFCLYAVPIGRDHWCFAAGGMSCTRQAGPEVRDLVDDLNSDAQVTVERADAAGLLALCLESGAFEIAAR